MRAVVPLVLPQLHACNGDAPLAFHALWSFPGSAHQSPRSAAFPVSGRVSQRPARAQLTDSHLTLVPQGPDLSRWRCFYNTENLATLILCFLGYY